MKSLTALSVSIAVLAGLATFLAVGPTSGIFLIWAATIAWAAYFALGGDDAALKNTIICGIFGVFMAWLAAIAITNTGMTDALGLPIWASIVVTATVLVMCLAAYIPTFATIPASVLGYSAAFAYLLQTPDKLSKDVLYSISFDNPLILISVSFIVGTYFGLGSAKLSARWTTEPD
jgi:ABC-type Co2+ transport system permease subunit